jgi:hypothetical protein
VVVDRRRVVLLFVVVACGLLLVQAGQVTSSDGASSLEVAKSIVNDRDLTVPAADGVPGRDGETFSKYGLGLPLLAALPYALVKPLTALVGKDREAASFVAASVMPLVVAGIVVLAYLLGRRLGSSSRSALVVAFGIAFGTFLMPYSKEFYSEPLVCLALLACFLFTHTGRHGLAAVALGYACLTRPQTLLLVPVFLVFVGLADRRQLWRATAVIGGFVMLMALYNWARFDDPLQFGYPGEGFAGDPITAGEGLAFDSTKSVVLFAPCVVLVPFALASLWSRARTVCALMAANLVLVLGANLLWHDWRGGWCWGPRLLLTGIVPVLPALAPWLNGARRLRPVVALFVLGFVVSLPAMLVPTQAQQLDERAVPRDAPAVPRQYALVDRTAQYTAENLYDDAPPGSGSHRKYLSLWQVSMSRSLGRPGLLGAAALTTALAALGAFAGWRFAHPRPTRALPVATQ